MNLTNEEKKRIAEWMGWKIMSDGRKAIYYIPTDSPHGIAINFDLNDAAIVVNELVKQGKFSEFEFFSSGKFIEYDLDASFTAWLLTMHNGEATNFFRAFAKWIKENEKKDDNFPCLGDCIHINETVICKKCGPDNYLYVPHETDED